jgi:hypothetical protein
MLDLWQQNQPHSLWQTWVAREPLAIAFSNHSIHFQLNGLPRLALIVMRKAVDGA